MSTGLLRRKKYGYFCDYCCASRISNQLVYFNELSNIKKLLRFELQQNQNKRNIKSIYFLFFIITYSLTHSHLSFIHTGDRIRYMCRCLFIHHHYYLHIRMNDLTKTFICSRCSFPTQRLYEHLHKCVDFYACNERHFIIRQHIDDLLFFPLLKAWHCVEHLISGITNLFFCVMSNKRTARNFILQKKMIRKKENLIDIEDGQIIFTLLCRCPIF